MVDFYKVFLFAFLFQVQYSRLRAKAQERGIKLPMQLSDTVASTISLDKTEEYWQTEVMPKEGKIDSKVDGKGTRTGT